MEILLLGEKIKRLRKEKKLTLKDLAGDRITPGQISLVESGKSNPSMDLLVYLAEALDTSVEYLIESEESQAEKICEFYQNLAHSSIIDNGLETAEEYIEKSLYFADTYNLQYRSAKAYYLQGRVQLEKGNLIKAQQFFLSANSLFTKEKLFEEVVDTFIKLGSISYKLKAYHSSVTYFEQAEKVFQDAKVDNDLLKGKVYFYLAQIYHVFGHTDNALNFGYLAREKFKQLDNKKEYGKTLMLLANEYINTENLDLAIKYSKKAMNTFNELDDKKNIASIESGLGKLFYKFENIEESQIHYERAHEIRKVYDKENLLNTLIEMCQIFVNNEDIAKARKVLVEIYESIDLATDKETIKIYMLHYKIDYIEKNIKAAEKNLLLALNAAKEANLLHDEAQISLKLGNFYLEIGENKEVSKYLNIGMKIINELGIYENI